MDYRRVDPDMGRLRSVALDASSRYQEPGSLVATRGGSKLAKAFRVPDVTIGAGYAVQGSRGPDNQQMGILNLGVPLPLFNRNKAESSRLKSAYSRPRRNWIARSTRWKTRWM